MFFLFCLFLFRRGLSKAARCSCFLAFVTSERTLIAYGIVRVTDNVFDWGLARWIEEISELKPQECGCVPVLEERGRPARATVQNAQ